MATAKRLSISDKDATNVDRSTICDENIKAEPDRRTDFQKSIDALFSADRSISDLESRLVRAKKDKDDRKKVFIENYIPKDAKGHDKFHFFVQHNGKERLLIITSHVKYGDRNRVSDIGFSWADEE